MAAGAFSWYSNGLANVVASNVDIISMNLYAALLTSSYSPDIINDADWTDVSAYECSDPDYSQLLVTNVAVSIDVRGLVIISADDLHFLTETNPGTITAKWVVIYADAGTNLYLLGFVDLNTTSDASSASTTSNVFFLEWPELGMVGMVP